MSSMRGGSTLFMTSVLGASLLFGAVQAHAAAVSSATASNLTFTLYDLDPTDDVLPSYSLGTSATSVGAFASLPGNGSVLGQANVLSLDNVTRSVDVSGVMVSASSIDGTLSASGAAMGAPVLSYYSAVSALGDYSSYWPTDVTLSAHSLMVISVWAEASTFTSVVCPAMGGRPDLGTLDCPGEEADASVVLNLWYQYGDGHASASMSTSDQVKVSSGVATHPSVVVPEDGSLLYVSWTVDPAVEQQAGRWLSVVFANTSDVSQVAKLSLKVAASGMGMSLVPEASTASLMGLGLLGLAVVAGRRRRADSAPSRRSGDGWRVR